MKVTPWHWKRRHGMRTRASSPYPQKIQLNVNSSTGQSPTKNPTAQGMEAPFSKYFNNLVQDALLVPNQMRYQTALRSD